MALPENNDPSLSQGEITLIPSRGDPTPFKHRSRMELAGKTLLSLAGAGVLGGLSYVCLRIGLNVENPVLKGFAFVESCVGAYATLVVVSVGVEEVREHLTFNTYMDECNTLLPASAQPNT